MRASKLYKLKALEISHILDLRDFPNDAHKDLFTKDFNDILNDEETKIVAETMGGVNPAFDFTMKLLKAGKSVVTSNKERREDLSFYRLPRKAEQTIFLKHR